jgi:microcystin-dependent protein
MANLTEAPVYDAGIYRIETTDAVVGGEAGIANIAAKNLANRTAYLKAHIDSAETNISANTADLVTKEARIVAIEASKIQTLGGNYSRGIVTVSTGSPMIIASTSFGKLSVIDVNATSVNLQLPSLSGLVANSIFDVVIISTSASFLNAKITITNVDGSVIGNVNDFAVGDSIRFVVKDASTWLLIAQHKQDDSIKPGTTDFFSQSTPPTGYIAANGAAISRTTYARLFASVGVTHGAGDGVTTFNIPDLRGVVVRGFDNGRGLDSGRVFGTYQADELKAHLHTYYRPVNTTSFRSGSGGSSWDIGAAETVNTSSTGGTETRMKNIALLGCIKY